MIWKMYILLQLRLSADFFVNRNVWLGWQVISFNARFDMSVICTMPLVIFKEIAYIVATCNGRASMLNDAMQFVSMLRLHRTDVNIK